MPFKGIFNALDHLKHCSAVQQKLPTEFDGSANKVWLHKNKLIHQMEATGLVYKFEVIIQEHLCPPKVTKELWMIDQRCFQKFNFLLDYSVITLPCTSQGNKQHNPFDPSNNDMTPNDCKSSWCFGTLFQTTLPVDCRVFVQLMDSNCQRHNGCIWGRP